MKAFDLTVMMYHYVRDPGDGAELHSSIPGMPKATFEAQLDTLASSYTLIAWPALREHLLNQAPLPSRACLLTFDDGVRDHYLNVYPALKARHLSGLFFALARLPGMPLTLAHKIHFLIARLGFEDLRETYLNRLDTDQQKAFSKADSRYRRVSASNSHAEEVDLFKLVLQRDLSVISEPVLQALFEQTCGPEVELASQFFLSPSQAAEMATGGMYFGGHSESHPWLDWIPADQQAYEIEASRRWLAALQPGPWAFAYPYGGLSAGSPALLREHSFLCAFTTRPQLTHPDPYQIGRLDAEDFTEKMLPISPAGGAQ